MKTFRSSFSRHFSSLFLPFSSNGTSTCTKCSRFETMFFDQNTEYSKIWNFKRYLENVRRCIEDYFHDLKCGIHELRGAKMPQCQKVGVFGILGGILSRLALSDARRRFSHPSFNPNKIFFELQNLNKSGLKSKLSPLLEIQKLLVRCKLLQKCNRSKKKRFWRKN